MLYKPNSSFFARAKSFTYVSLSAHLVAKRDRSTNAEQKLSFARSRIVYILGDSFQLLISISSA